MLAYQFIQPNLYQRVGKRARFLGQTHLACGRSEGTPVEELIANDFLSPIYDRLASEIDGA